MNAITKNTGTESLLPDPTMSKPTLPWESDFSLVLGGPFLSFFSGHISQGRRWNSSGAARLPSHFPHGCRL